MMLRYVCIGICLLPGLLQATIIGSDVSVSRQTRAFFKRITSNSNIMKGFSVFEKGFVLENPSTTAEFDAFFPIRGDVVLNGGALKLLNDLEFKNPFRIGVGSIIGNGFSLVFPSNISYLDFPSVYYIKLIVNLLSSINVGKDVYSISWSPDDKYVAFGLKASGGNAELKIYEFIGETLFFVAQQDFGSSNVNSIAWHPSLDYIAIALSSGTELQTWFFNRSDETLSLVDSANIGNARAVAWCPDGNYLAVGERSDTNLQIYPVVSGILGTVITGALGQTVEVLSNALSWHSDGTYCATGLKKNSGGEFRIFSFDGSTCAQESSFEINEHVNSVAWRPNSSLIAAGINSSNESLRMYAIDETTHLISEVTSARVGLQDQVLQIAWDSSGIYLAVTKEYAAQGYEVEVYYFSEDDNTLHLVSGYSSDAYKRAIGWAHSGNYFATGDDSETAYLFNFTNVPFVFENLKLYFGSEIRGHADIYFKGNCTVNGGGNSFKLGADTNVIIESNSSLILENIELKGIQGSNVRCVDDTGVICLRNARWAQEGDFTFTHGAFHFVDDVRMEGNYHFVYATCKTSTVSEKSRLILDPGFTFSFDPISTHTHLIELLEPLSLITLNGATIATGKTGMQLIDGSLRVERDSFLEATVDAPLYIGNGDGDKDCYIDILSGVHLHVTTGALHYYNALPSSWNAKSYDILHLEKDTQLILHSPLNIGNGTFYFNKGAYVHRMMGGDLIGKVHAEGPFIFEYER